MGKAPRTAPMPSESSTASPLRRRGRPQRLPVEAAPFGHPTIDIAARTAWLLTTSRLLSPTTANLPREEFLTRLRDRGIRADTSRISRWESGQLGLNHAALSAYEATIGLPDLVLVSATNLLRRSTRSPALLEPGEPLPNEELDGILDLVESRGASGGHWVRITGDLARFERVYLHRSTWNTLCTQLLAELTRSAGPAFLRRYEAASTLLAHPQCRGHLSKSLGRFVMHPHAQNVGPVLTLLREVGDDAAGDLVLRLMGDDNDIRRRGATEVAPSLASRGHLPAGWPVLLEQHAGHELRQGGALSSRIDAIDLMTDLPQDAYERVLGAIPDPHIRLRVEMARCTMELVPNDLGRAISEGVATVAEAASPRVNFEPDQMLRRLVREALFHVQRERRHLAAVLLAVSPYARAVARTVLDLTVDRDDLIASMSWSMLRRFGHVLDRNVVAAAIDSESRDGVRARGLVVLGLAAGELDESAAGLVAKTALSATDEGLRHAAVLALGMSDHTRQLTPEGDDPLLTRGAAWWRSIGPAIHDADVLGTV